MMKEFEHDNVMQAPGVVRLLIGMGEASGQREGVGRGHGRPENDDPPGKVMADEGQAGRLRRSDGVRGSLIGVMVMLRSERMWSFLYCSDQIALPRSA